MKEKKLRLKWKMADAPTGRYRAFEKRGWPSLMYTDAAEEGTIAAMLRCNISYHTRVAESGEHPPITVHIAFFRINERGIETFDWRKLKKEFANLEEAKAAAEKYVRENPSIRPRDLQEHK